MMVVLICHLYVCIYSVVKRNTHFISFQEGINRLYIYKHGGGVQTSIKSIKSLFNLKRI